MAGRGRRRWLSALGVVLSAGVLFSASASEVGARPDVVLRQSDGTPFAADSGTRGVAHGARPSVSGNGRYVVYQGGPASLPDGTPSDSRTSTIYLTDNETDETVELTAIPEGLRSGDSVHPVISGDGCTVVVVTEMALDVFRDDDQGSRWDVYRSTLPHCEGSAGDWDLVSTRTLDGGLARDDVVVSRPTVSRSGSLVAYTHPADHLFEAENLTTITLVDLAVPINDPGRSRIVTGMPADIPNNTFTHVGLDQPALSGNGEYLAYRSDAVSSDGVPLWADGPVDGGPATRQVFVWDIDERDPFLAVQLVSRNVAGEPSSLGASSPAIARDGGSVAFVSSDMSIVAADFGGCDAQCASQVYVLDRDADDNGRFDEPDGTTLSLASAVAGDTGLIAGDGPSSSPAISADGHLVAFVSRASNLQMIQAPGAGGDDDGDLLLADIARQKLDRVTVASDGVVPAVGAHAHPDVSDTARTIVFDTLAANDLLPGDVPPGRTVVTHVAPPSLSLADADLGTTVVGLESDEWFVAVVNDGPSSFDPVAAAISGSEFTINEEKTTCIAGNVVPPGEDCVVAFRFTPLRPGSTSATLEVTEFGYGAVSISSRLSGAGGAPTLRIGQNDDFEPRIVGSTSPEYLLDVMNVGVVATRVGSVDLSGAHPDDFSITSNLCVDRPLNPRANCTIGITFSPSDAGRRTALVTVTTETNQYTTMVVAGDGLFEPEVALAIEEVAVGGDVPIGATGFPANTELTVVFGDGPTDSVTVTTDETGSFLALVPVAGNERGGERTLVVQSPGGAVASAGVRVVDGDDLLIGVPGFGLGG